MADKESRVFTLGHSPDPDDAFMFYAMAEHKIDLRGYQFEHRLEDIQTLNERALRGELHISAISMHAYARVTDHYALLPCGASMGDGYGPMIVCLERDVLAANASDEEIRDWLGKRKIAVPGLMTSAYLALRLYLGDFDHLVVPFDQIFDAVKRGAATAGLIIHEGQLTYADAGLQLWADLGAWWLEDTGLPLPLGGNAVRRDLGDGVTAQIARDLRASIEYALAHRAPALAHAKQYNRGIGDERTDTFVGMYVNQWTVDYGPRGRQAVQHLLNRGHEAGIIPERVAVEFIG